MNSDQALVSASPTKSPVTWRSSHHRAVGGLVAKAYLCAAQAQPTELVLVVEAAAWAEVLAAAGVPEADLTSVYLRAMAAHTSAFRLNTGELISAWIATQTDRAAAAVAQADVNYLATLQARRDTRVLDLTTRLEARLG